MIPVNENFNKNKNWKELLYFYLYINIYIYKYILINIYIYILVMEWKILLQRSKTFLNLIKRIYTKTRLMQIIII